MSQLAFEWHPHTSYAPEDFIVSSSNDAAAEFLKTWPDGGAKAALLSGEKSCGKTHLVQGWLQRTGGVLLDAAALGRTTSDAMWPEAVPAALEDIGTIRDETALFHLLRHAETGGKHLLLTANAPAQQLPFTLPDLRSRLLALPAVSILPPDEKLLEIFTVKCFSDRQLRVGEEVVQYITKRTERSFGAVLALINRIENISLETGREITVPLVGKIMVEGSRA